MNYYKQPGYQSQRALSTKKEPTVQANSCNERKSDEYIKKCNCLDELPLAIAYVPWQRWSKPLSAKDGLEEGTIFSELILPFYGCNNKRIRGNRT